MRTFALMLALVWIALPQQSAAEYYKYRDANGVVRFTDNLAEVPEDQRVKENRVKGAEDAKAKKAAEAAKAAEDGPEPAAGKEKPQDAVPNYDQLSPAEQKAADLRPEADALNEYRLALEKEYKGLLEEKAVLNKAKADLKPNEHEVHNQKVRRLNAKIADFEKRRMEFKRKVEEFNTRAQ